MRVVGTTLLLSSVVVVLFTSLLLNSVGRGLVDAKTRASLTESRAGVVAIESGLLTRGEDVTQARQLAVLSQLVGRIDARGASGGGYAVALLGRNVRSFSTTGLAEGDIPAPLMGQVSNVSGTRYAFADVRLDGRPVPSLVVGNWVEVRQVGGYRLFHVFPLTAEQNTLSLVRRTALFAGVLLVLLLAALTRVVVRQVVVPVRSAARTAERLAAGNLDERLRVRGEDEIALLGTTFNSMAGSLQTQIGQLEDLSRVQRRFVSDVSHELRTPLTTVRMAADVLYDGREDYPAGARRSAELLQAELDRFETLLADLLEISRHDAGATDFDPTPADLGPLVRRVVAAAQPLADRKGVRLDVSLPSRPTVADVEQVRIERVLRNLVVNAVEHGEGRPVAVTLTASETAVVVTVRDHGVGLEPGQAGMVFTRFWRADPSRARTTGGTGLGLAIALEDVRLHGGWLQAAGAPGRGSIFRMTVPRAAGRQLPDTPLVLP